MGLTVFYSWQSDSPKETNRDFIESVLEKAIKKLSNDVELQEATRDEPVILDKDTKNIPGTPPIVDTIFNKITDCSVFVPDLSFVGHTDKGKPIPNPNVLIEYGWALRVVGHAAIVPVMNTAFGIPDEKTMPFDMRHVRFPTTYCLRVNESLGDRSRTEDALVEEMTENLKLALSRKGPSVVDHPPFQGTPFTENPSTFLAKGETLPSGGRFGGEGHELVLPPVQHLFLRLIPRSPLTTIRSNQMALEQIRSAGLYPMADGRIRGFSYARNRHGACSYEQDDGKIWYLSQLFKTGELWGINAFHIDAQRIKAFSGTDFAYLPITTVEEIFLLTLTSYLKLARETLHLEVPLRIVAGATDVKGYKMGAYGMWERYMGSVLGDHILWSGSIDNMETEASTILTPFWEYLWEEFGLSRPKVMP